MGQSRLLFSLFSSFQCSWQYTFMINVADDWIRTADLWSLKRSFYHLSQNHCPSFNSLPLDCLHLFSLCLWRASEVKGLSIREAFIKHYPSSKIRERENASTSSFSFFVPLRFQQKCLFMGCRHSSVDLSAPSILPPRVWVPITLSMLLSIYILNCIIWKRREYKHKRDRDLELFKKVPLQLSML